MKMMIEHKRFLPVRVTRALFLVGIGLCTTALAILAGALAVMAVLLPGALMGWTLAQWLPPWVATTIGVGAAVAVCLLLRRAAERLGEWLQDLAARIWPENLSK